MISSKLEKLINLASSDNPNEAENSAKMAVSLMKREGTTFDELLTDPNRFYLESLVTVARSYSVRTTQTPSEAQKVFSDLLQKTNQAYNPSQKSSSSHRSNKSEHLRTQEEQLRQREEALKKKEENLKHREHSLKFNEQFEQERAKPTPKEKQESESSSFKSSHNIKNHFLNKCITRPFRTLQLFFISLFYGMFHSFLINIVLFAAIIFGFEFTYHPGIVSFFFIVAFPFMVWKSYKLYDTWY